MKANFSKRLSAYIIDSLIIMIISLLISFFLPTSDKAVNTMDELSNVIDSYSNKEITDAEYIDKVNELNYVISKENVATSILSIIITVAYFGAYSYYMNGQTIGKKVMHIKIVSTDSSEPTYFNYVLRCAIIHGCIFNAINLIMLFLCNYNNYLKISSIIDYFYMLILFVSIVMMFYNKNAMGIHDYICKTKVINTK